VFHLLIFGALDDGQSNDRPEKPEQDQPQHDLFVMFLKIHGYFGRGSTPAGRAPCLATLVGGPCLSMSFTMSRRIVTLSFFSSSTVGRAPVGRGATATIRGCGTGA